MSTYHRQQRQQGSRLRLEFLKPNDLRYVPEVLKKFFNRLSFDVQLEIAAAIEAAELSLSSPKSALR